MSLVLDHVKIKPAEIDDQVAQLGKTVSRRSLWHTLLCLCLAAGSAALLVLPPVGVGALVITAIFFFLRRRTLARQQRKVEFVAGVLQELRDELHPAAPIRFTLDLRAYDVSEKIKRKARSYAGNTKVYYSDTWLKMRLVLADRSVVELEREAGLKKKKGAVVKEKRRLFLTLTPNPRRYYAMAGEPAAERLRHALRVAISHGFHDRPELVHPHIAHHQHDIALKLVQEDAEILPPEVTVILHAMVAHLRERCALNTWGGPAVAPPGWGQPAAHPHRRY